MADDLLDAHIESFVWTRVLGYDLLRSHGRGVLGGRLYSQVDVPRMRAAGMTGGVFSVATNPFRSRAGRRTTLLANLVRLRSALEADPGVAVVADAAGYRRARAEGRMGCFLAVQGGNAVTAADVASLPDVVSRVTVVHLTRSALGSPARPFGGRRGLTSAGREYVAALDARRILVDLAHLNQAGFWDALAVHDPSTPAIVSHTGVRAVHDVWRNIDDDQIRAIAATGGVVGIMYHSGFLGESSAAAVVRHLEHVVDVGGEDCAALGSDWDGFIVTPRDLRTVTDLPVLLSAMRAKGFSDARMAKITAANYLRVVESVRG
jgi:membrane dipeptidase